MTRIPAVLICGAPLVPADWARWAELLTARGLAVHVPERPDGEPDLDALVGYHAALVESLERPPVLIGYAAGGLIAQVLLGAGLGRAAVAIAPSPGGEVRPDTANAARGPLLIVSGQEDEVVPDSATRALYKSYGDSTAVTDLKQFADRGHSLVLDAGWREVADHVLAWLSVNGVLSED